MFPAEDRPAAACAEEHFQGGVTDVIPPRCCRPKPKDLGYPYESWLVINKTMT
ncbi:MAG: hypothetical protein IT165_31590 [Bryobacterales bacterium]|nr:hypothetical protein [Bryobacterales bacterium]